MPIDFWITVPAVWSDRAKADTLKAVRQAARQARVTIHPHSQVFLICEPEAAAVAALSALTQGNSQAQVKIGDGVLICDCGGGTVDLTTYHITAIDPKLEFKELIIGTGKPDRVRLHTITDTVHRWKVWLDIHRSRISQVDG